MPAEPGGERTRRLISSSAIGSTNRVALLYSLAQNGPMSRAELARQARVPRGSVAPIVNGLLVDGFLVEGETTEAGHRGGKPARPLWFGPRVGVGMALHLSADCLVTAVVEPTGAILAESKVDIEPQAGRAVIERTILTAAAKLINQTTQPLSGIGLVWPAMWDPASGVVVRCTPMPGIEGSDVVGQLGQSTGLEVLVEDDARALAVGQHWFGEARGVDCFAALQLSSGIGAGLLINGRLHQVEGRFPEVGHMCVQLGGAACYCGRRGCWETVASLGWLRDQARQAGLAQWPTMTPARLARLSDPAAATVLGAYADNLATGIVNLAVIFGLNRFYLHGEVTGAGPAWVQLLRDRVAQQATLPGLSGIEVVVSTLDQRAALLGAAALPLTHRLNSA